MASSLRRVFLTHCFKLLFNLQSYFFGLSLGKVTFEFALELSFILFYLMEFLNGALFFFVSIKSGNMVGNRFFIIPLLAGRQNRKSTSFILQTYNHWFLRVVNLWLLINLVIYTSYLKVSNTCLSWNRNRNRFNYVLMDPLKSFLLAQINNQENHGQ